VSLLDARQRSQTSELRSAYSKLHGFEDERFYAVLDVALDIRCELDFEVSDLVIPVMRRSVRYPGLLPVRHRTQWIAIANYDLLCLRFRNTN
jgi:hypothetical protein